MSEKHIVDGGILLIKLGLEVSDKEPKRRFEARLTDPFVRRRIRAGLRACLKIAWGPAARDFGRGQGGEARASPQRAVRAEPTPAPAKRAAAQRVFAGVARWLCCSSVRDRCGYPPSSRLAIGPPPRKQDSHGIFRQALRRASLGLTLLGCAVLFLPQASRAGLFSPKGDSPEEKRQVVRTQRDEMLAELYKTKPDLKARLAQAAGYATFKQTDMNLFLLASRRGYGVLKDNKTGKDTLMGIGCR